MACAGLAALLDVPHGDNLESLKVRRKTGASRAETERVVSPTNVVRVGKEVPGTSMTLDYAPRDEVTLVEVR